MLVDTTKLAASEQSGLDVPGRSPDDRLLAAQELVEGQRGDGIEEFVAHGSRRLFPIVKTGKQPFLRVAQHGEHPQTRERGRQRWRADMSLEEAVTGQCGQGQIANLPLESYWANRVVRQSVGHLTRERLSGGLVDPHEQGWVRSHFSRRSPMAGR